VHSAVVLEANEPGVAGEGDALITNRPGLFVSIRTADCVPILLVDRQNRAVAAVHAGWRGTVAGILSRTLEKMAQVYQTSPSDVRLAFGPAILSCCFEVGEEVAAQFGLNGQSHVDLVAENQRQAAAAGVSPASMDSLGLCTSCNVTEFYSFRKERDAAGRMYSAIRIRP
jgi:polyphenol oxidase